MPGRHRRRQTRIDKTLLSSLGVCVSSCFELIELCEKTEGQILVELYETYGARCKTDGRREVLLARFDGYWFF